MNRRKGLPVTREQFFIQLEEKLRSLPETERRNILGVYDDLFNQAMKSGKTEEEVIQSLGYSQLYGHTPTQYPLRPKPPTTVLDTGIKAIMASLALGMFNLIFVLGPFLGVSAALFSLCVAGFVLTTSPLWILLGSGMPKTGWSLGMELFSAMAGLGLGTLLLLGLSYVVKGYFKLVKAYFRLNLRLIKGE